MSIRILGLALAAASPIAQAEAPKAASPCVVMDAPAASVSLDEALARAISHDLRPGSAEAAVAAAKTERAIASLRPADSVSLETEDFPGRSGLFAGHGAVFARLGARRQTAGA
jgi:outer membrane protein, heavy metal efflux system